jgi:hypothetical protein
LPLQDAPAILALLAGFAVLATVFGALTTGTGGWRVAAGRFGTSKRPPESADRYRFTSIRLTGGILGLGTYKNIVFIALDEEGIWLSLWGLFGLLNRPILIPWDEVRECRAMPLAWAKQAVVTLREGDGFVAIGAAAGGLLEWWEARRAFGQGLMP